MLHKYIAVFKDSVPPVFIIIPNTPGILNSTVVNSLLDVASVHREHFPLTPGWRWLSALITIDVILLVMFRSTATRALFVTAGWQFSSFFSPMNFHTQQVKAACSSNTCSCPSAAACRAWRPSCGLYLSIYYVFWGILLSSNGRDKLDEHVV